MQFQFNSDHNTARTSDMADHIETIVTGRMARIVDKLARVEVRVGDINRLRGGGNDKRAAVEARPVGMTPISATHQAGDYDTAVLGATDKVMATYDREIGKRTDRKGH